MAAPALFNAFQAADLALSSACQEAARAPCKESQEAEAALFNACQEVDRALFSKLAMEMPRSRSCRYAMMERSPDEVVPKPNIPPVRT